NGQRPHSSLGYLTPAAYAAYLTATCDRLRNPETNSPITRCSHRAKRRNIRRDSNRYWVKLQGQVSRTLRRSQVLPFFRSLPACLVGMEACASAHHWAREIAALGHSVRMIAASLREALRQT
ncbi:hypothetical protein ABIB81_007609, partial [Bradyrhizobium sp. I1.7.5]